jgi:hypothetical protein
VSAALKHKASEPTPTPFPSAERAALAHAIAAAADAGARRSALEQASKAANSAVLAAIASAEAAEAALEEAGPLAVKHVVDKALDNAGAAPLTIGQARAAVIQAQDALEEARATRAALKSELDRADTGLSALLVQDAARAVIRSEMQQRAVALAARVAEMQRQLVVTGSALEWLAGADVFPKKNGKPADDAIRHAVWRMGSTPGQWVMTTTPQEKPFAQPVGAIAWQAAFEALKRDPTTPLPEE